MSRAGFTSPLAERIAPDLLARFERYVRIDTQAKRHRVRSPSSPGQLELGRLLVAELTQLGLTDAALDADAYVMATVPASNGSGDREPPVVGLIAHMDTSPDAPGAGVEPIVHREYDGEMIVLPKGGTRLDPAAIPKLQTRIGHDIVTSSGDTLLGGDDKAGVASIMAAVAALVADPSLPRPTLRIAFTPDEEVGEGAKLFDLDRFGARCAYTIDGGEPGELQDESFSAIEAVVEINGIDVHPGAAKGKMVSALRLASRLVAALPSDTMSPETTSGHEGFIHPFTMTGTAAHATITLILRDFDERLLGQQIELLRATAEQVVSADPRASFELNTHRQYRNMREFLERDHAVVAAAVRALGHEGIEPIRKPMRGGTDGSILSERGLPTPNLFNGSYEWHSVREWASVQDMAASAATLVRLAGVWAADAAK